MLAEGEYNPSQGTSSKNDEKDQNHYVPPAKRWSQLSFRRFAKMSGINRLPPRTWHKSWLEDLDMCSSTECGPERASLLHPVLGSKLKMSMELLHSAKAGRSSRSSSKKKAEEDKKQQSEAVPEVEVE